MRSVLLLNTVAVTTSLSILSYSPRPIRPLKSKFLSVLPQSPTQNRQSKIQTGVRLTWAIHEPHSAASSVPPETSVVNNFRSRA